MNKTSPSRFQTPDLENLPNDIKERIGDYQKKFGFVPNVILALAHRPTECRLFFDYRDALMEKESGLSKAEKEMIVVATSNENDCLYCVVSHGAALRVQAKNPLIADQVATNYRKADITPRQMTMLDFAVKVCNDSGAIEEEDYSQLMEVGFSEEDVWDIVAITAFYGMSNRLASAFNMQPNEEFYGMGRDSG